MCQQHIPGTCTRVLVLSVTDWASLCPARGIYARTTLAWNTAALLQPPREITVLFFGILAPLNPNKGSWVAVAGITNIVWSWLQGLPHCRMLLPAFYTFSCPPERAWQAPPCNWVSPGTDHSLCSPLELPSLSFAFLSVQGCPAGLQPGDCSLCFVALPAGAELQNSLSGSWRVNPSPFRVTLDGIFPREWLSCLSLSMQGADTCFLHRLLIRLLWGRREGSMISPTFWRALISLRRSQKTAFSGSKLCQFCKSSHA